MPGPVAGDICRIHASCDDPSLVDEHAADGRFVGFQGKPGLRDVLVAVGALRNKV